MQNFLFAEIDIYKSFVVAFVYVNSKPTNIYRFLTEFVTDLNNIYGKRCKNRIVYDSSNYQLITDISFRNHQNDSEHHIGHTPLIYVEPKINFISHFVVSN